MDRFAQAGIHGERIELHGILPRPQLIELLGRTDVALDPFPYAGTTTTCEVLWMGVPVVTLAGATSSSRCGASLLATVGLDSLVARTPEQYLEIAARIGRDRPFLSRLRRTLRDRMRVSPLLDGAGLARELESAYRTMWRSWCRPGA